MSPSTSRGVDRAVVESPFTAASTLESASPGDAAENSQQSPTSERRSTVGAFHRQQQKDKGIERGFNSNGNVKKLYENDSVQSFAGTIRESSRRCSTADHLNNSSLCLIEESPICNDPWRGESEERD
ncbi:Hypothetical predicted protein [Olea europaea subsp. europaea]|uniref:Uncharacterized protein n=1 Tax=Olea europaea subsp. europaea TaxID=158383 RepID=A0A8S0RPG8_OLEEU|nr:Hypothetical predicted protein [Olea europaea subsp. europaea]